MKKTNLLLLALAFVAHGSFAQKKDGVIEDYMRSSLYTIILDDHGLMDATKAEIIKTTFFNTPLPEKFNDHNLDAEFRTFNPALYSVTNEDVALLTGEDPATMKKGGGKGIGKFAKSLAGEVSGGMIDTTDLSKLPAKFIKYFEDKRIANQMIAKWYDLGEYDSETSSHFDMDLIKERGLYNATEFDKSIADKSARGIAMLADAGENLIKNTFIVGIRFNYVNKEEVAKKLSSATSSVAGLLGGSAASLANSAVKLGTSVAGKGYVIKATAFLYQLDWNEEVANEFYTKHYNADDLDEFLNSDIFKLKYIGSETEWTDIQSSGFSSSASRHLIERATIRSIDEVTARLQKKFEAFRTKTPLLTTQPEITAQIGLKEGLEGGNKYEVLEKIQDPETNIVTYKRVAVIKVDKKKIWDNRYAADIERAEDAAAKVQTISATHFTGSNKNIYPGMLIRQIN